MKSHEIAAYNATLAELAKLASDMNCSKALAAIARLQVNIGRNWDSSDRKTSGYPTFMLQYGCVNKGRSLMD
jgi:hypothetical protein